MKAFIPGQAFKNKKYYVFDKHGVTVMKPWPYMLAYRKTKTRAWKAIRPKFRFGKFQIPNETNTTDCYRCYLNELDGQKIEHECKPDPLISYLDTIPKEILELIKEVGDRQWHLLALFSRCGTEAIDLYKSTPALAWMLSSSWAFKDRPVKNHFRSIRRLLKSGKSQLNILDWLDFPSYKHVIKLLRKVDMSNIDVTFFLHLKTIIANQVSLKTLRHVKRIDYSLVRLLATQPFNYSYGFLTRYQALSRNEHYKIKGIVNNIVESGPIEKTFDLKYLNLIVDMIEDEPSAKNTKPKCFGRVLPIPDYKLPENFPEIEYIDTEEALFEASNNMHNCLSCLAESAYSNEVNFFRINYVNTAVFSVIPGTNNPNLVTTGQIVIDSKNSKHWVVNEIKETCNKEPSGEVIKIIEKWLDAINRVNPEMSFGMV